MLGNTSLTRRVLGGVAGVNLALALAVSAGAVPRPGDDVHTAAATAIEEVAAPAARQPGDAAAQAAETPATTVPVVAAPPTTAAPTTAAPKVTAPPTTKAPKAATPKTTTPAPVVTTAPPATVPAVVKVALRVPTAAEVQGVIAEMKKRVPLLTFVSVSPAQVDQIGDQACTAFDNGQSFAQVKATGLSMIPAGVSLPAGTDDWAVRKAVALYCPGHADKLV